MRERASSTSHLCLNDEVADSNMFRKISLKNTCAPEWGNGIMGMGEWENRNGEGE